ncbi:MAG: hypothetical protein WCW77_03270 [Patescibacteria group bacterium]
MTSIETLAVWSMGILLLALATERAKAGDWRESMLTIAIFGSGIFGLVMLQPVISPWMQKLTQAVGGGYAAVYFSIAVGIFSGVVAWFVLTRYITRNSPLWNVLAFTAITVTGTAAAILYFRPGFGGLYHIQYLELLGLEAGLIMLVGAIIYWRHGPQNVLANPIAFIALVVVINWLRYIIYRVNSLTKIFEGNDPAWWGPVAVVMICITVMSFIWDKGEEWSRRMSYKILWPGICISLIVGMLYLSGQMLGFTNRQEAEMKGLLNQAAEKLTKAQLDKIKSDMALAAVEATLNNPTATLDEIKKAYAAAKAAAEKAEVVVAGAPDPIPTYNEKKVGSAWEATKNGMKEGATAVKSAIDYVNPWSGNGGGNGHRTSSSGDVVYINETGATRVTLKPGMTTSWFKVKEGLNFSFSAKGLPGQDDPDFSVIPNIGKPKRMKGDDVKLPPEFPGTFKIRAEDEGGYTVRINVFSQS